MSQERTGRRRLYLMRHGHVDYFAPGITDFTQVPLTEEGCAQASAAGEALAGLDFDQAFFSGLPRTEQTLSLVLKPQRSAPSVSAISGMAEIRGGQAVVATPEELAARLAFSFDTAAEEGASFLPGGELFKEAEERILAGLHQILTEFTWKTAILVAHEGVNRILLAHLTGGGLGGLSHFEQDLCGINVLDFDVVPENEGIKIERTILKAVNLTVHDQVKEGLPRTSLEHLFGIDFGGARPRHAD